jgi:hypothetical protein
VTACNLHLSFRDYLAAATPKAAPPQELKRMKNLTRSVALSAVMAVVAGRASAQSALDLPGMMDVLMHYELQPSELETTWPTYVGDAVLVSQAVVVVQEVKPGLEKRAHAGLASLADVHDALLSGALVPQAQAVAYPLANQTWAVVSSDAHVARLTESYMLNAQARLQ